MDSNHFWPLTIMVYPCRYHGWEPCQETQMWITTRTLNRRGRRLHHNVKLLCPIRLCLQVPAPHLRSDNLLIKLHLFHDGAKVYNYEEACYVVR